MSRGKRHNAKRPMPVRLDVPGESRGFKLTRNGGLTLIAPPKIGKSMASDWPPEDRPYRSVIIDSAGRVVSAAFPKFGNYGEYEDDTTALDHSLAAGEPVWHTLKEDGSLIVRSVIDGAVVFRTRGTFDGGLHGAAARRLAAQRYSSLLDPHLLPDTSLLFEFVSPEFQIVLSYPEEDLVLVGAIEHATLRQYDFPELEHLAQGEGLRLVEHYELPSEPEALIQAVAQWRDREGLVVRCNQGQTLIKLKAADYLARHRLRFALSARAVREICLERDVKGLDDFEIYLKEVGGDWELVEDAKPLVEAFCTARAKAQERVSALADEVAAKLVEYPVRKDFALEYATKLSGAEKAAAFSLADQKPDQAYTVLERSYLDEAFAGAEARDELLLAEDEA